MFMGSVVNSPDRILVLQQEAVSATAPATLDRAVRNVINWPDWLHATWDAALLDGTGRPLPMTDQTIAPGRIGRITVSTKPRPPRTFPYVEIPPSGKDDYLIGFIVTEYVPERLLRLQITKNTAIKITNLFDQIEWRIELSPEGPGGTRLKGKVTVHTAHWRARLFGILIPRYFLQQIFLPSVEKLAKIDRPLALNPQLRDSK